MNAPEVIMVVLVAMVITGIIVGKWLAWNDDGEQVPGCYGDYPNSYQYRAEYDCMHCPFESKCWRVAAERHRDV